MKSALPLLLLLIVVASSSRAETPLLANVSGRTNVSLNGSWRIIVDPYETGLNAHYWENKQPQDKSALVEYNFDTSETLSVPVTGTRRRRSYSSTKAQSGTRSRSPINESRTYALMCILGLQIICLVSI
jgi:hypothetical protein